MHNVYRVREWARRSIGDGAVALSIQCSSNPYGTTLERVISTSIPSVTITAGRKSVSALLSGRAEYVVLGARGSLASVYELLDLMSRALTVCDDADALEAGGATIAVLPHGIRHFSIVGELRGLVDLEHNLLALSAFDPDAGWRSWRAMERNKLIVGLSSALFVIEARERGGTIDAAHECVRQRKKLYAMAYPTATAADAGNRRLLAGAAIPLRHTRDLERALSEAMSDPPSEVEQLVFNLLGPSEE